MIGKISHGNSFGDCLDYLTRVKQDKQPPEKRVWHIIDSEGVRLNVSEEGWRKMAVTDMERPTLTRSKIESPLWTHFTRFLSERQRPDDR